MLGQRRRKRRRTNGEVKERRKYGRRGISEERKREKREME